MRFLVSSMPVRFSQILFGKALLDNINNYISVIYVCYINYLW